MNKSIKIDSVFLDFGPNKVLRGVSLEFHKNQVTGILGRNGCGKSCLLKTITGRLSPQSKHIQYDERKLENLYKIKGLINYLPQHEFHPHSLPLFKLLDFYGIDRDYFLDEYRFLEKCINSKFSMISGGERRIIEVLIILEAKSEYTILDEPFSHVMPKYIDLIKDRINKLKSDKGILLTDHQYENVLEVSDNIYLLSQGIIREVEEIEDLKVYGYIR